MNEIKYCMWVAGIQPESFLSFPFIQPGCLSQSPDCYFMYSAILQVMPIHFSLNPMRIFYLLHNPFPPHVVKSFRKPPMPEACNFGFLRLTGLSSRLPAFCSSGDCFEKENSEAKWKMAELVTLQSRCLKTQVIAGFRVRKHVALERSFIVPIT